VLFRSGGYLDSKPFTLRLLGGLQTTGCQPLRLVPRNSAFSQPTMGSDKRRIAVLQSGHADIQRAACSRVRLTSSKACGLLGGAPDVQEACADAGWLYEPPKHPRGLGPPPYGR